MRIAIKRLAGAVVLHAGFLLFPLVAGAAGGCPVIEPNYGRICGTTDPRLLRHIDEIGGCFDISVNAASKWNASGIRLAGGQTYAFKVLDKEQKWLDQDTEADANGWTDQAEAELTWWMRDFFALLEPLRRAPDSDWFYLMGMVAEVGEDIFPIGMEASWPVENTGEFCAFANDLPFMYGNNSGKIKIRVTREGCGKPKPGTKTPAVGAP